MNSSRIFDILEHQLSTHALEDTFARREDKKSWTKYSTQQIIDLSHQLSVGLLELGLKKGDKIAIISSTNRPEWHITDIATLQIGLINVPIYPTISAGEYEYIFQHAEIQYVFISDRLLARKLNPVISNLPQIKGVYSFDNIEGIKHWKELLKDSELNELYKLKSEIKETDTATIIYTSGTTGQPKGVMLSHYNIMSNVKDCVQVVQTQFEEKALSFLPLCHVFERILNYTYMYSCSPIYFADGLESIAQNIVDVRVQYFATVPRLIEKIYEGILRKARGLPPFKKKIFIWALRLAEKTPIDGSASLWSKIQLQIADKLVFKKWREALGGQIKAIICGSAPLQARMAQIFNNAQIPLIEGYGLTETSPVLTVNPLKKYGVRPGSVGVTLPSVHIKFAEDGEILVNAPNVMQGYYKDKENTQASFTDDGWLKTGDIGYFTDEQYLVITDRKKELFKTSGGKYVAPAVLENKMKESPYIEQIVVVGDGEKFVSALIVPNFDFLEKWCQENHLSLYSKKEMIESKEVNNYFFNIVQQMNIHFSKVEQIKRIALLENEWTIEGGELTATMKTKRKYINNKYKSIINSFYNNKENI
ncbi:MAG: long-chain fatty acid--CoA ligase [Chitinophagales bacterium]|nr:long-chain fatty acid--CoA ligase [Chitinophagales bacterium]